MLDGGLPPLVLLRPKLNRFPQVGQAVNRARSLNESFRRHREQTTMVPIRPWHCAVCAAASKGAFDETADHSAEQMPAEWG